ncbi:MAG: hypothetical protein WB679_22765 [Terracidiphilus sp.]
MCCIGRNKGNELRTLCQLRSYREKAATEHCEQSAGRDGGKAAMIVQDAVNTMDELRPVLPDAEREGFCSMFKATLGEAGEAGGVRAWSLGDADYGFIAGHLALLRELTVNPPKRGIQREENQAKLLGEIGPVIETAEVFCLMENDLIELSLSEAHEQPIRNEDAWGEEADDTGAIQIMRGADLGGAATKYPGG